MRGVRVSGNRTVEVVERPRPKPEGCGQVLVRAVEAGICGTDVHPYRADPRPGSKRFIQGHELTGLVEEVGPGVENVQAGDRIVSHMAWGCGRCEFCASGYVNLCGDRKIIGKADRFQKGYSVVTEAMCMPLPDEMSFDDGIMLSCAGGTAWSALQKVKPSCDDVVAVFGLGPVGLMAVMWARAMGAYVIGVEIATERLKLGKEIGVHVVIDAKDEDPVERIRDLTDGEGATVAFEASGNKEAQRSVLQATHWAARVVYVAAGPPGAVISPGGGRRASGDQLGLRSVHGTFTYSIPDYYRMVKTILLHGLKPGQLVTHRFPIEEASEAYALAETARCGKVVLAWD